MKKILTFFIVFSFFPTAYANIPKTLIPCGEAVGIGILTEGLLVVDTKKTECENGDKISPAENADIKPGDRIISADGKKTESCEDLLQYVSNRKNDIVLTVKRDGNILTKVLSPVLTNDGYRLGILVRDSVAGLGTITYIDPDTNTFGALGHGISDIDTNTLFHCRKGLLFNCNLTLPEKSKKGAPGALCADFGSKTLAQITTNSPCGLFGKFTDISYIKQKNTIPVASANEIETGDALILSNVDENGVKEYKIKIKKFREGNLDGKNIVFKVCDEDLISKTGGIVQGMSGSPILQDGKLVGAVTHVFVNDPTRGYGIFIENMLSEAEKIK